LRRVTGSAARALRNGHELTPANLALSRARHPAGAVSNAGLSVPLPAGGGGMRRKPIRSPAACNRVDRWRHARLNLRQSERHAIRGGRGGVSARVVALLTLAAFINYVDPWQILRPAGPADPRQFALSNTQLGLLLSAFF